MIPNPLIGMLGPDGIRTQKVPQPGMKEPQKQGGFMFNPQPGTNPVFEAQKLEIKKKNEALQSVIDQLMEGYTKRAAIKMQLPQEQKVNAQDALTAGFIALAAQLAGARPEYAQKGFQGFMQGSQSIADSNNARNLAQAQLDYQNRTGMADAEIKALQLRGDMAQSDLSNANKTYANEMDFATQQAKLEEDARQFNLREQGLNSRAELTNSTRRFVAELNDELKRYLNENPQESIRLRTDYQELVALGYDEEEARALATSQLQQRRESARLSGAKTNTEDALRPGKVEKQAAEIEKIYADVKVKKSQVALNEAKVVLTHGKAAADAQDRVFTGGPIGEDDRSTLYKNYYDLEYKLDKAKARVAAIDAIDTANMLPAEILALTAERELLKKQIPAMQQEFDINLDALKKAKRYLEKYGSGSADPMTVDVGNLKPTSDTPFSMGSASVTGAMSGRGMGGK